MFCMLGIVSFLVTTLATLIAEDVWTDARKRAGCKGRRHNTCVIDAMVSAANGGGANAYGA
jgi:hypothetical protein